MANKIVKIFAGKVNRLDENNFEIIIYINQEQVNKGQPELIIRCGRIGAIMLAREFFDRLLIDEIQE
jgi:hypothetical protein